MTTNAPANDLSAAMRYIFVTFPAEEQLRLYQQITVWIWKYTLKIDPHPKVDLYDLVNYVERLTENAQDMILNSSLPDLVDFFDVFPVEMQYRNLYFLTTTICKWQLGDHGAGISDNIMEIISMLDHLFELAIIRSRVVIANYP
jgi:hypothetical protein